MRKTKHFTVDARTILQLGRDSIKNHTTALAELVKNSYDADATNVELEIYCTNPKPDLNYIRVADNGFGMSEKVIDDNWLRIGFSEKREKKRSKKNRRKTGEKGIGRIAADRLGATLILTTKEEEDTPQSLKVNWDDFDVTGKSLSDIDIEVIEKPKLNFPLDSRTGTEIKIKKLRQVWTKENIEELYQELSTLVSPFSGIEDFKIELKTDITPEYKDIKVESTFLDAAEISLDIEFDGKQDTLTYYIDNRRHGQQFLEEIKISQIIHRENNDTPQDRLLCGPFKFRLLFYLRDSSILERSNFSSLREFKKTLDQYIGIKVYRDQISVKPYGFPNYQSGDWLDLAERKTQDPAGVRRSSYRISPNQLVGAVFITRDDNPELRDSAAREGLVENEAFNDLKEAILRGVMVLEAHRHSIESQNVAKDRSSAKKRPPKSSRFEGISNQLSLIGDDLRQIGRQLKLPSPGALATEHLSKSIEDTADKLEAGRGEMNVVFEELLDENRVLSGLATLGITTAVFGHETQSGINTLRQSAQNAKEYLSFPTPKVGKSLEELKKVDKYSKLVAGWGSFALARIRSEKRKNPKPQPIHEILDTAIKEIQPAFDSSSILLKFKQDEKVISKVYPMDIEAIIFNLLTNAYQACKQVSRLRRVEVILTRCDIKKKKGYKISVTDSGPGIAKEFIDEIWKPLFTTKIGKKDGESGGTGLGLTIVESTVNELEGEVTVIANDERLGGAKFSVWLPKNT